LFFKIIINSGKQPEKSVFKRGRADLSIQKIGLHIITVVSNCLNRKLPFSRDPVIQRIRDHPDF